ncbi:hypothetical protein Tco_1073878 [Tanacetum coccineum]
MTSNETLSCEPTVSSLNDNEIDFRISFDESDDEDYTIVVGYTEEIVHDFKQRLEMIFGRQVNRVHILDFEGLTPNMRQDLAERLRMVYIRDDGQELGGARRSMTWRQFIIALGLHTTEEMAEEGFRAYWLGSERVIPDKGDLSDYWVEISFRMDFLRDAPSYTYIRDPVWRLCHRLISYIISGRGQAPKKVTSTDLFYLRSMDRGAANVPYLLAQYLFRHIEERKSGAKLSGGYFIGRLAHYFGMVSDDGLRGLSVVTREIPLIDMGELVVMAGALKAAEDALVVNEGAQAVPAPAQAPQPPPPPPATESSLAPYDYKVTIRSRPSTILFIKERPQISKSIDSNLVFDIASHTLLFGRSKFCLVTGFAYGKVVFPEYMDDGIPPFLSHVFSDKENNLENKASLGKAAKDKAAKGKAAKRKAAQDLLGHSRQDSNPITQIRPNLKDRDENWCIKRYDYVACKEISEQVDDQNGFIRNDEPKAEQDRSGTWNG